MASVMLDAQELGLLLQMLRQVSFPGPLEKHVAANLQTKAAQAAEVFPSLNGDQAG